MGFVADCKLSSDAIITEVESLNAIHCGIDAFINNAKCMHVHVRERAREGEKEREGGREGEREREREREGGREREREGRRERKCIIL